MSESWLTIEEAASLWRVCPQTVRNWGKRGFIKVVRLSARTHRVVVAEKEMDHGLQGEGRQGQEAVTEGRAV